ncbi:MAG: Nramp family divalent metal transporter [Actinomycetales bacterium]
MSNTVSNDVHTPARRSGRLMRLAQLMGPAFIVGAWQFGPGNLTSAVQAGSRFGYSLLWVIALSTVLMLFFTDMSVRIAIMAKGGSLIEVIKARLGRATGVAAGIGVFCITLMFSVGNAIGAGLGLSLVFGGSTVWWTLATTTLVAATLLARRLYGLIEKLLLAVIIGMGICFVLTAVLAKPDWGAAAAGLVPSIPAGTGLLLVALVGTNFSINAAFYTGYASRERGLTRSQYRETTLADTIPGIVAPGVMTMLVIIAAAAVLSGSGSQGATLAQLADVLEPVAGPAGRIIFALGFFGAAFSSMIANATAGGTLLADGLGFGNRLSSTTVKLCILAVLVVGAAVTVLFAGSSPVQMIIVAQALTVVVAPLLGVVLVILANNGSLMLDLRNRLWQNIGAAIGLIAILATCYRLVTGLLAG